MPALTYPTILIGYGDYGLQVMRKMLSATASRGLLRWETHAQTSAPSERRLRDLILLHAPGNRRERSIAETINWYDEAGPLGDLFQQIRPVQGEPAVGLKAAIADAAQELLRAHTTHGRRDAEVMGLDVLVLMRPESPGTLGFLEETLFVPLRQLSAHPNLQGPPGGRLLNCHWILDFDDYWLPSDEKAKMLRVAVGNTLRRFENHYLSTGAGFTRVFLMDGRPADGVRARESRIEEASLFVELFLYEGLRRHQILQKMFRRSAMEDQETPISTVGVRLAERSSGLLSRLAGAMFGIGWLDFLLDQDSRSSDALVVGGALEAFRGGARYPLLEGVSVDGILDTTTKAIMADVAALSLDENWRGGIQAIWRRHARNARQEMSAQITAARREIASTKLKNVHTTLTDAVTERFHAHRPASLRDIIAELEALREQIAVSPHRAAQPESGEPDWGGLRDLFARWQAFREEQVNVQQLPRWWTWYVVLVGFAVAAVVRMAAKELVVRLPAGGTLRPLMESVLVDGMFGPASPAPIVVIAPALGLLLAALLAWSLHRALAARSKRAHLFFTHSQRGRFVELVERELAPGGRLRTPLEAEAHRYLDELAASLRHEVESTLDQLLDRMVCRQRELQWLRSQLNKFLTMHGVDINTRQLRDAGRSSVHFSMEQPEELQAFLQLKRPEPENFFDVQRTMKPFTGWQERYHPTFLYPFRFLDNLSQWFPDPSRTDRGGTLLQERGDVLRGVLKDHGKFSPTFFWPVVDVPPKPTTFALLSEEWKLAENVENAVCRIAGVDRQHSLLCGSEERCFLLSLQLNVPLDYLHEVNP